MTTSTVVFPGVEDSTEEQKEKLYHLIMLNDDEHTYEYVIEMLQKVMDFPHATAVRHTMEADMTGSSILITCGWNEAEGKRERIHAYGPDWRLPHSRGSVAALIDPA
jgi:ATP-dependent Clp protease adaptor protein ClpS